MRLNDFVELKCFANLNAQCAHRNLLNKILTDRPTSFRRTSRFKPSLPAGRSVEQVHGRGRWSKIRQGGYSAGKARRIIPQIIEKIETRAS